MIYVLHYFANVIDTFLATIYNILFEYLCSLMMAGKYLSIKFRIFFSSLVKPDYISPHSSFFFIRVIIMNKSGLDVVFWPSARANMPFQSDALEGSDTFQWPVIERDRVGGLRLIIWDNVNVPLCHYRVMHREIVTCELHDSYFRLMTIKHTIPKIELAFEWTLNYYITQSRQKSESWSWRRCYRRDVVGKATSGRRGP